MSEAAVLISGLDTLPSAAGVPASPAGTAPGSGFAGVLSQSMQGADGVESPPPPPPAAAVPAETRGEDSPQSGNPLPLNVAKVEGDGDAVLTEAVSWVSVPVLDALETGLPVTSSPLPASSADVAGLRPGGLTQPTDIAALPAAASPSNSGPTVTIPSTNPLPAVAGTVPSATLEPAAASSAASSATLAAAPPAAGALPPMPALETQAAGRESLQPDWLAMRMAKAGGLDQRPAVTQAASLNRQDRKDAAGGEDFLQMLGIRPASTAAVAVPSGADGGRSMMPFLPERFLGEGQTANLSALSAGTDTSSTSAFSMMSPAASAPGSGALPTVSVATPVGQGNWSQDIGQRVTWLANQEIRTAQIQLNPQHLGPVEVRISYGQEQQLSVSFIAHHPQAREALDAMLPRLREMFDAQGLNLADVSVSQESFTERRRAAYANPAKGFGGAGLALEETDIPPSMMMRAEGLFDAYA